MTTTPTIDPGSVVSGVTDSVTSGVGDNLPAIGLVAGSLVAVTVVWKFLRKMVNG